MSGYEGIFGVKSRIRFQNAAELGLVWSTGLRVPVALSQPKEYPPGGGTLQGNSEYDSKSFQRFLKMI